MDRVLAVVALAAVAGCSSGPKRLIGGAAVLSAVSVDQKWVAAVTPLRRLATGAHVGELEVAPATGGPPTLLDNHSVGGVFNRGTTLWYEGGVSVVSEDDAPATPPVVEHVYGGLFVWAPGIAEPAQVGTIVRDFTVPESGSAAVFMDWASPSDDPATLGTVVAVSASSCIAGACNRMTLASGVTEAQAAWRVSTDGRFAIFTVRGATETDAGQVVLVSFDDEQASLVSTGVNPRSPMMSHDGSTVAWIEGLGEIHVMPSGGGTPTVITTPYAIIDEAVFIDGGSFVVKVRDVATDPPSLITLAADGSTTLLPIDKPQQFLVSQAVPGKTDRYVFFQLATLATNAGEPDLWLLDLVTPGAQPVQLAVAVEDPIAAAVTFSDDGSSVEFRDNFNPVTRRGDEYIVPLTAPTRTLVSVGAHNAAFIPGGARLIYINAPDPASGGGVLSTLSSPTAIPSVYGVGDVNFADPRSSPARTWFTQTTGAPDDGVWSMPQP
jgi:hypothetical protein